MGVDGVWGVGLERAWGSGSGGLGSVAKSGVWGLGSGLGCVILGVLRWVCGLCKGVANYCGVSWSVCVMVVKCANGAQLARGTPWQCQ